MSNRTLSLWEEDSLKPGGYPHDVPEDCSMGNEISVNDIVRELYTLSASKIPSSGKDNIRRLDLLRTMLKAGTTQQTPLNYFSGFLIIIYLTGYQVFKNGELTPGS